ncbi:MAG TPA: ROK family protein [Bacteroides sp.]|nr:ROK family protein [Bacteroides sp.]
MTLDAGGTNLVFSAIRGNQQIVPDIHKPSSPDDLEGILESLVKGFEAVSEQLPGKASAISFAFPGPADYPKGIIGDLPNFKAFQGGVALGPMLEDHFGIPVYINNDGNLFAYGEALAGFLPDLNKRLEEAGSLKRYDSLIGFTLGTGFGAGIVLDNKMIVGNSSSGAEIHNTLNQYHPDWNAEESVSTRAIRRVYAELSGIPFDSAPMPAGIYEIAKANGEAAREAAREAFVRFGRGLGSSIANAMSLIDGIVVLGGGITAAWDLFAPAMFREINREYRDFRGNSFPRLSYKVYNLEDEHTFGEFVRGKTREITVPGSGRKITYDDLPRTGVGRSALGASRAIALGAYAFALQQLDT